MRLPGLRGLLLITHPFVVPPVLLWQGGLTEMQLENASRLRCEVKGPR